MRLLSLIGKGLLIGAVFVGGAAPVAANEQGTWLYAEEGNGIPVVPFLGIPLDDHEIMVNDTQVPTGPASTSPSGVNDAPRYTFEFQGVPLFDALQMIARKTGSNIVLTSNLSGVVTLSLRDVTLERALDIIAQTQGLS